VDGAAYFAMVISYTCKRFMKLPTGAHAIEHFTAVFFKNVELKP
jgi:hypothetical protein